MLALKLLCYHVTHLVVTSEFIAAEKNVPTSCLLILLYIFMKAYNMEIGIHLKSFQLWNIIIRMLTSCTKNVGNYSVYS